VRDQEDMAMGALARTERHGASLLESLRAALGSVKIRRNVRTLRVAETLSLGDRRMLVVVEWSGEKLLLGVTPQQINLLDARQLPAAAAGQAGEGRDE